MYQTFYENNELVIFEGRLRVAVCDWIFLETGMRFLLAHSCEADLVDNLQIIEI